MTTSFSTKQRSQMLRSRAIVAPASTLTWAQMRVPSPTREDATSAVGWIVVIGSLPMSLPGIRGEVLRAPLPVELDGPGETVGQVDARLPSRQPPDLRDVRHEIARLLRLPLRREVREDDLRSRYEIAEDLGDLEEGRRPVASDVHDFSDHRRLARRLDQRFDAVLHVEEVAQDPAGAEEGDRLA